MTTQATQLVKNVTIGWKNEALGKLLGQLDCKDIEDLDQKIAAQTSDSIAKEKSLLSPHLIIAGIRRLLILSGQN